MRLDRCTEEELWRVVAAHLEKSGIPVVLVGGALVSIYSKGAYRSGDLDFVRTAYFGPDVEDAMARIGFGAAGVSPVQGVPNPELRPVAERPRRGDLAEPGRRNFEPAKAR